jgi:hypothetical protein
MLKNKRRVTGLAGLLAVLAVFAALLPGGTAQAAAGEASLLGTSGPADLVIKGSSSCTVGSSRTCKTAAVQALGGNMVLNLLTVTWDACHYKVVDVNNSAVVREGDFVGAWRPVLTGVYSWYQLQLSGCVPGSWGYIEG